MEKLEYFSLCERIEEGVASAQREDELFGNLVCTPIQERHLIKASFFLAGYPQYVFMEEEYDVTDGDVWHSRAVVQYMVDKWKQGTDAQSVQLFKSFIQMGERFGWD